MPVRIAFQQIKLEISAVFSNKEQDTQMHCNVIMRCIRTATVALENKKSITFSEYISVTLVIQHVVRVRHIVICFCMALQFYFSHYLLKQHDLYKKVLNVKRIE